MRTGPREATARLLLPSEATAPDLLSGPAFLGVNLGDPSQAATGLTPTPRPKTSPPHSSLLKGPRVTVSGQVAEPTSPD